MDEADRRVLDLCETPAASVADRAARVAEVEHLVRSGAVRSAEAKAAAAEALLPAATRATVELARDLALAAVGKVSRARVLAAQSFDRLRVLDGLPQKFGTQRGPDGAEWPCDPATTDSERSKWGLPSLAELRNGGRN